MKKTIYLLLTMFVFSGCEELGLANPENKLIGTWKHIASGAAAGGGGKVTYKGQTFTYPRTNNDAALNLEFKKDGVCNCGGEFDKYKVSGPATGGTIIFTNTSTSETYEYEYSIGNGVLNLFETIDQWKKDDSGYSAIDLVHSFEKP